jgi:RNA polymerase sigma-70 factor, ECF subfamily
MTLSELDEKGIRDRHRDFEREAMPHINALYNFALRMTGDPDDANDLLQETYMKAYRFWDKFEPGTNCKAWLFTIMFRLWGRQQQRFAGRPELLVYDEAYEHGVAATSEDRMIAAEVLTAVDRLAHEQRSVLLLSVVEGFAVKEIAAMLSIPLGTVMSRLSRARAALRQSLRPGSIECRDGGKQ